MVVLVKSTQKPYKLPGKTKKFRSCRLRVGHPDPIELKQRLHTGSHKGRSILFLCISPHPCASSPLLQHLHFLIVPRKVAQEEAHSEMFFQRKNSKKVKNTDASSPKKDKDSRGKNDFFDRAKGGFGALAGSIKSAKNDAEERAAKVQEDVNAGIEAILETGSGIVEQAKEDIGGHSETDRSKEQGQGSEEEQGEKDMDALSSMLNKAKDKVKSNPDVMEKVNSVLDKVKNHPEVMEKVAEVLHLGKHESKEKEAEAEEMTKEGETSAKNTQDSNILDQAVEEIQAVVAAVQQQETTGDETQVPVEAAAETDTPAQGDKPEEVKREAEKDNPKNRIDFVGFFAMMFERFCSPADKKKD